MVQYEPLPVKKYKVIYADPPWEYQDKALMGNRGACCKYPVLSIKELSALGIKNIADDDCILFLWVTLPKLNEVFDLITAWGFEYKTVAFIWVKTNKDKMGWFLGMGRWTRSNSELCLLATKGNIKRLDAGISQIIAEPIREHSKKPDCVRKLIVNLVGDLPRIELFTRQRYDGWDCWGNQLSKTIQKTF